MSFVNNVLFLEDATSTMDVAKELLAREKSLTAPVWIVAARQHKGRGRNGSEWIQSDDVKQAVHAGAVVDNTNQLEKATERTFESLNEIYPFTIVVPTSLLAVPLEWVSIMVGCALIDTFDFMCAKIESTFIDVPYARHTHEQRFCIKWPNDIVYYDMHNHLRKASGILCEMQSLGQTVSAISIGIGLNFSSQPTVAGAGSVCHWLFDLDEKRKNDFKKIQKLISSEAFQTFAARLFYTTFSKELGEYLTVARKNEQIKNLALERMLPVGTLLSVNKGMRRGPFRGLTDTGGLLVEGSDEPILSGDISILSDERSDAPVVAPVQPVIQGRPLLAIDIGNTRLHWGFARDAKIVQASHVVWKNLLDAGKAEQRLLLGELVEVLRDVRSQRVELVYASVLNPASTDEVMNKLTTLLNQLYPELKLQLECAVSSKILEGTQVVYAPGQMGVDRSLRFRFLTEFAKKARCAVATISLGTATTIEAVAANGAICESLILPGLQMGLDALAMGTQKLPQIDFDAERLLKWDGEFDTESSMERGAYLVIQALMTWLNRRFDIKAFFLCGGNARSVFEVIESAKLPREFRLELSEHLELTSLIEFATREPRKNQDLLPEPKPSLMAPWLQKTLQKSRFQSVINTPQREFLQEDFRRIGGRLENVDIGMRIDRYLATHYPFLSREIWYQRLELGEVRIQRNASRERIAGEKPEFETVKPTYRVQVYDQIWIYHPPEIEPEAKGDCTVIYDDGDIVAFHKPGNLVIHAAGLYLRNTFVSWAQRAGYGDAAAVHRIDRETSGLLLCARKYETRLALSLAFRSTAMKKMYLALTKGTRPHPHQLRIAMPIGPADDSRIRLKMWVDSPNPQEAVTDIVQLSRHGEFTLYACFPRTGRTNQIRIHLAAIGHWIVGDKMYHPNEEVFLEYYEHGFTDVVRKYVYTERQLLHSATIRYPNDVVAKSHSPIVCPLPPDFIEFGPARFLLEQAGLSVDVQKQTNQLLEIFNRYADASFENKITEWTP